ncbi:MAG: hypothetical protein NTW15_00150 [Burkholderiales bacterium]|nr:hypothetical protein [Burkholderiales bacterium]
MTSATTDGGCGPNTLVNRGFTTALLQVEALEAPVSPQGAQCHQVRFGLDCSHRGGGAISAKAKSQEKFWISLTTVMIVTEKCLSDASRDFTAIIDSVDNFGLYSR